MTIPRLPADTQDLTVSITVSKKLRPYFTKWYQEKKLTGETPEQFAIRQLKIGALNDYFAIIGQQEIEALERTHKQGIEGLQTDMKSMEQEMDT